MRNYFDMQMKTLHQELKEMVKKGINMGMKEETLIYIIKDCYKKEAANDRDQGMQ